MTCPFSLLLALPLSVKVSECIQSLHMESVCALAFRAYRCGVKVCVALRVLIKSLLLIYIRLKLNLTIGVLNVSRPEGLPYGGQ